jgi:dipeptide/tripeptide permease
MITTTSTHTPDLRKNPSLINGFRMVFCGLLTQGFTVATIAMLLCLPLSTSYSWNAAFNASGFGMIETQIRGRKFGQGRILSPQQETEIEYTIINFDPVDKGMVLLIAHFVRYLLIKNVTKLLIICLNL